jgi:small subunit ribosomal protein S18
MSESSEAPSKSKSKNPEHYSFMDRDALAKYTTDTGKIISRKYTGLTPMQQRKVSRLIKKARHMLILK